jgi:hypothetical protein
MVQLYSAVLSHFGAILCSVADGGAMFVMDGNVGNSLPLREKADLCSYRKQ